MKTCPDCGERVYNVGCVNCNEAAYIQEQREMDADYISPSERADIDDAAEAKRQSREMRESL